MKLYRFTARGYANGRIVEPGESILLGDDVVPSAHMVDVQAESEAALRGETLEQPAGRTVPGAIFRSDIAYDITKSGGVPYYDNPLSAGPTMPATITTDDGRTLAYDPDRKVYVGAPVVEAVSDDRAPNVDASVQTDAEIDGLAPAAAEPPPVAAQEPAPPAPEAVAPEPAAAVESATPAETAPTQG